MLAPAQLRDLVRLLARFFVTSGISTLVYWGGYLGLRDHTGFSAVVANVVAYSGAVLLNFTLQKFFIFESRRSTSASFLWSVAVSVGGLGLSTFLVWLLGFAPFFADHELPKVMLVSGLLFFYNFFLKRFAFERRFV